MLTRLIIRNYAIIPSLDIDIHPGLTIITGETGAGKSILLGALGLALGKRADSKVLPDENAKCVVEAYFQLEDDILQPFFTQEGLDYETVVICRREIGAGGRSRSFINDTPVSLKLMQDLTAQLIELHHQHDNLALQSKEYQIRMLDTMSAASLESLGYSDVFQKLQKANHELTRLQETEQSALRRKDFLTFQSEELHQAKLQAGEVAALEESQNMLEHAETIDHVLSYMQNVLMDSSHSLNAQITGLIKQIESIRHVFPAISEIAHRVENLRVEVQDLGLESGRLEGPGQKDPARLSKVHTRLNQLYTLIKKYQCRDESELIAVHQALKNELTTLESVHDQITEAETRIIQLTAELKDKAEKLSKKRKNGAKKLIPQVASLLRELGMTNARFDIDIQPSLAPASHGMDDISFVFSANLGSSMQPLQAVASGGELSRLSLALKSIYASQAQLPTIIFDEIDTGISGEVAWRMGQLIRSLSKGHQVLMITHSPQIAAHAQYQYHVSKKTEGQKDISAIQFLNPKQRVTEIAKMLSGDPPSKAAISNAESLLQSVKD